MNCKEKIEVKDLNGNTTFIKGSVVNHILTEGKYSFNEQKQVALVEWSGYNFYLGPDKVEITDPNGRVNGSHSSNGYGSRNYHIALINRKISLSRLWCLVKAIHYKALPLYKVDDYVHNHLDNKGNDEAMIQGTAGLKINNYELCTFSQNTKHGKAWNKIYDNLGLELSFSAYNKFFIDGVLNIDKDDIGTLKKFVDSFLK